MPVDIWMVEYRGFLQDLTTIFASKKVKGQKCKLLLLSNEGCQKILSF